MQQSDIEFYCYLSYVGPFWFIGLLSERRSDRKLRFHLNQGIVLFCAELLGGIAAYFIGLLLRLIPYVGVFFSAALWLCLLAAAFWLAIRGMMCVAADTKTPLPIIGALRIIK